MNGEIMAIRTDRFRVKAIRPAQHLHTDEVPADLKEKYQDKVITLSDLEELGATLESQRLYHGGQSLVVIYWHGQEYALHLEPVA